LACTRGKQPASSTEPGITPTAPSAAAVQTSNTVDEDWQLGRLPASVTSGTPVSGGELVVTIPSDPPSLNTIIDNDGMATRIVRHHVCQALVGVDPYDEPAYRYRPELAERWDVSEDGKTYTFHLRKDLKWHDGQPFTSKDVIATFDKIQDPTTKAATTRSFFEELKSYSAPDDYTVVTAWKRPYFLVLDNLSDTLIQPAHVIGKLTGMQYNEAATNPLNRHPIGTGPFRFVEWQSHAKIVLARNDAYAGRKTYLDRVVYRIQGDPTVMLQLAERNEIDLVQQLTSEQWVNMTSPVLRTQWNRVRFYPNFYAWIGWNAKRPYFADKNVRRALTMLVDRPGIIDKLLFGLPRPTTCHFYWKSAECDPELKPLPYDPEAAGKLLDAAGWSDHDGDGVRDKAGRPFHFVFMLPSAAVEAARWAAKIKEDLSRVGIEMELQKVEWAAFSKRLRDHEFDACTLLWGSEARGDPTQIWHSSAIQGGSNYVSYKNAAVDKLIEDGRTTLDDDARNALFRKLGAILHDEQPYTWMYIRPQLDLISKRVKGLKPSLYWWQFEDAWLDPQGRGPGPDPGAKGH
jgi:peptide/nickel transport system substrate-binding protein